MSLINPLDAFPDGVPKMEESSIFASLSVGGRTRSIINISKNEILSEKTVKVNFLGFDEKTQSFTTNWSEITGPHTAGNEPEGFGMTNINIEVNPSYVPKVTISFVDIRGASLFNIGASSKYAVLFQFPPPEYTLTIKGYFGRALTYGLHMTKQNSRFNSKTGNFEITAEFIAITFAPLADIPVAYIKAAPFMVNQSRNIDPKSGNVNTFYELINASRVLNENIEGLKQTGDFKEFEKLGDEILDLEHDIGVLSNFGFLTEGETLYESNIFSDGKVGLKKLDGFELQTDKFGINTKELNFDENKKMFNKDLQNLSLKEMSNKSIIEGQEKILELIKFELNDKNNISSENIGVLNKIGEEKHFNLDISGTTPNLIFIFKNIPQKINEIRKKKEKLEKNRKEKCDKLSLKVKEQEKSVLNFRPTIYNIFKIICDDTDTFIRLLKETSESAQKDDKILSFLTTNAPDAKVSDETKQSDMVRYAWPDVIEDRDGKKNVRIYPGGNKRFENMPEVKFVDSFIDASIEIALNDQTRRNLNSTDDKGAREWMPLGPFEELTLEKSDYGLNGINHANILGILVRRAQVIVNWNLRHVTLNEGFFFNWGTLEGDNIIHQINDKKILEYFESLDVNPNNIENILNNTNTSENFIPNIKLGKTPKELLNEPNLTNIEFFRTGEKINDFPNAYRFNNVSDSSVLKIEDFISFETTDILKDGVKDIKDGISLYSSIFGANERIKITNENKIIYKDNEKNSESSWFDGDLSEFSFPPLKDFNNIPNIDKINNYSNTVLKPLFVDGSYFPLNALKITNTPGNIAENFLFNLIPTGISAKELLYDRNNILPILLNKFIEKWDFRLPGIIEIPYIVLIFYGWFLSILDNKTDFTDKVFDSLSNNPSDDIKYLKSLPTIIKDQLIKQYNDFKNNIFPDIKNKIIDTTNPNILKLKDNQFHQNINDLDNWGKPKSGNNWWEDIMKRKYLFIGLPIALIKPEELKNNLLDLNPPDRKNKIETVIRMALAQIKKLAKNKIKENERIEKDIRSQFKDSNIKLDLYKSFKSINDRWLSGGFSPFDSENQTNKLISKFNFVDRSMKDVGVIPKNNDFSRFNNDGDSMIIKFSAIENTVENNSMSLLTLIDLILTDNKFMFFPLQNFMKFDSGNWNNENIKNLFGFNPPGKVEASPVFTCLYIDSTSKFLDNKSNNDIFQNDGADLLTDIGDNVNAFVVKFGDPKQSMFKDINLDQAEFKETIESIKILDKISQQGAEDTSAKTILKGQNLFNTYEQRSYSCEVEMLGNVMIQPTQYFQLENVPMFHGAYMIINVSHNITPNQMTTKFKGVRIPKNSLPLVTDYATAVGFNLCTDSSVPGSNTSDSSSTYADFDIKKELKDKKKEQITKNELKKMSEASDDLINKYIIGINEAISRFKINTYSRLSMFMAQILHESGNLKFNKENISDENAEKKYGGREDLGNTTIGDGAKYKGRGLIQLTGKNNYKRISEFFKVDFIQNPDLVIAGNNSAIIAGWFWRNGNGDINKNAADLDDTKSGFNESTRRINGGYNGQNDRIKKWKKVLISLGALDDGESKKKIS